MPRRHFIPLRRETRQTYFDGRCDRAGCTAPPFQGRGRRHRTFCSAHLDEVDAVWDLVFFGCGSDACLVRPCLDCEAVVEAGRRVAVVGERVNAGRDAAVRSRWPGNEGQLYSVLVRYGGIKWGPSRDRLFAAGVRWDYSLNLLPPAPPSHWGPGDTAYAREVARAIAPRLAADFDLVVLMGARVADAFVFDFRTARDLGWPANIDPAVGAATRFLVIPHPSGRSQLWNDPLQLARVRTAFRKGLQAAKE